MDDPLKNVFTAFRENMQKFIDIVGLEENFLTKLELIFAETKLTNVVRSTPVTEKNGIKGF